jgi:hypothetical protein
MPVLAAILGCGLVLIVLIDAFNTIMLARRAEHVFRIARIFYRMTWSPFAAIGRRMKSGRWREEFLSVYGPLSLLALFGFWACGLVTGFGLLQWAIGMAPGAYKGSLATDLYLSAAALFTMTTGDPKNPASRVVAVAEGGLGTGFLGLVIGYLPVLYQSFSNRELQISLMDARAGSPPSASELLRSSPARAEKLEQQLEDWEKWEAQVLENHLSFPMMAYFRSQHPNQSWLTSLVAMADSAAVIRLCSKGDLRDQAELTFAMARHAISDIAAVFGPAKEPAPRERMSESDFLQIRRIISSRTDFYDPGLLSWTELQRCRQLYEVEAFTLSDHLLMSLPPWVADEASREDWRARGPNREDVPFTVSDPFHERSDGTQNKSGEGVATKLLKAEA